MGAMPTDTLTVRIPNRFEAILARSDMQAAPLILPVEEDLRDFERLRQLATVQSSGVIAFLLGVTGSGKTTAAYSAATHMNETFAPVTLVPHDIPLRDVYSWVSTNLPAQSERAQPVLLDGREITDDQIGLRQLVTSLNGLLRTRPDVLLLWPTTDTEWHQEIHSIAERVGGTSLVPTGADIAVRGPEPAAWLSVLERILVQLDHSLDDLALEATTLDQLADRAKTIGEFLGLVGAAIVERVDQVRLAKTLPSVTFVVTSTSEVVGEANRIRRARGQFLKADELLAYSPRSRSGKWWTARGTDPRHTLGYVISLFHARLATMTPSSVVYACAHFGDPALRAAVEGADMGPNWSNADRTVRNTDFFRLMAGLASTEFTSTRKGKTAGSTLAAYAAIQALSAQHHKAINQAICRLVDRNVPDFNGALASFEVDQGEADLFTDAIVPLDQTDVYLEFHHIATPGAAAMAAYVMEKLQYYAIRFNLVPR
jgi:hypothetical protein